MSATSSISNRLETFAERRLTWLLPSVAIIACVVIAWQSSTAVFVAEPAPSACRSPIAAPAAEQFSTMKPVVNIQPTKQHGLTAK